MSLFLESIVSRGFPCNLKHRYAQHTFTFITISSEQEVESGLCRFRARVWRESERRRERMEGWDPNTKSTLTQIPLLTTKAGPRDGAAWTQRLKEEYKALIAYTGMNKSNDNDWFRISAANPEGTRWTGKCWYVYNLLKYEFDLQFDIPVTYPATAPELELPELDGKTHKMYRGGKICLTVHFKPLWAKNCPRFGIAHALCLGLAPWLAAEVPILVDSGMIKHKDDVATSSDS
ncbi:Ubiquitin-fold modifier-conjugating enzyme 1 [Dillenia turbinata]|uniref:Ubiquitin-fold modifier-conjugating enzyme 1 n=1 Tax=Dillenia turbinata TaxID=194707 RepID=A0AAN8ZL22_9MAGN